MLDETQEPLHITDDLSPVDEEHYDALLTDGPPPRPFSFKGMPKKLNAVDPRHRVILAQIKEGVPIKQALANVGYSGQSLAKGLYTVTKTKSWQNLMDEYIPEEKLAARHNELLDLRKQRGHKDAKGNITHYVDEPDAAAVSRALEMGYKLRGAFKEPSAPPKSQNIYNLFYKPEVRAQVSAFEDNLKRAMFNEAATTHEISDGQSAPLDGEVYSPDGGGPVDTTPASTD